MLFNRVRDYNIKKNRINKANIYLDELLSNITDDNNTKGNIIVGFHWFIMALYIVLTILSPLTYINIFLVFILIVIHNTINIYFGSLDKCILVKLERYFYQDKSWYGPNTPFFRYINMCTEDDQKIILYLNLSFWITLYIFYLLRLLNKFYI